MPLRAPKGFIDENDPKVCQIGHPAPPWLINYADLMTELVCFFIILYALSAALNKNVQNAREEIEKMIKNGEMKGEAKVTKEGLQISLEEQGKHVFFQSASAELTPEMEELMSKVAPVIKKLVNEHDVVVEGHTDNIPMKNDLYQSNWELASARATNVVEYLIQKKGFPPTQMSAAGYGEFRPVCPANDTPECRSRNRRVVFMIKNPTSLGPPKTSGSGKPAAAAAPPAAAPPAESKPGLVQRLLSRIRPK